jgi:ABC-type transport system involved in multi-copper enzyme maturation permease subunit
MTQPVHPRNLTSWSRIGAIALTRLRRVIRTRIAVAAVILTLLPWLLVDSSALITRLASLAEFALVGMTVAAAGVIADDLDDGEYAVVTAHDASPIDVLAGQAAASLAVAGVLLVLQLPIALSGTSVPSVAGLLLCIAWLGAVLVGWLGLELFLGTVLEGKANAIAMIAMLALVPLLLGPGILDRAPAAIASLMRAALECLPQAAHATAVFRAVLDHRVVSARPIVAVLVSPFIYFTLAAIRLIRLEPAGRLSQ